MVRINQIPIIDWNLRGGEGERNNAHQVVKSATPQSKYNSYNTKKKINMYSHIEKSNTKTATTTIASIV